MAVEQRAGFLMLRLTGTPYELGVQHGRALRDQIWSLWQACERLVLNTRGALLGWVLRQGLTGIARLMERYIPRELRDELRGVAEGSGLPYSRVLLLNCFDDLMNNLRFLDALAARLACSAFAAVGDRAADGVVVAGRNLDYYFRGEFLAAGYQPTVALQQHLVVLLYEPAQGYPFVSVTWPGIIGVATGQNALGLGVACLTSPAWSERLWGTPLPLLYREIVQYADSLAAAQARLAAARRTIGNNLLVVAGGKRDARLFELTSRQLVARAPTNGVVAATNHFQAPALAQEQVGLVTDNSLRRLARLDELLAAGPIDRQRASAILTDERCLDDTACLWVRLLNLGTVYSTVFEPAQGRIWVRAYDRPDRPFEPVAVPRATRWTAAERGAGEPPSVLAAAR